VKFIADRTLGKLARELRGLGHDTIYYRGDGTSPLIRLARQEGRTILTRNTKLLPGRPEDKILRIVEDDPLLQLKQLIREGYLSLDAEDPFSRCLLCNNLLNEIPQEEAQGKVPDYVLYHQERFFQCPECRRVYWKGSHEENMQRKIEALFRVPMQNAK
jgi:uncharacterized protein with PIN domain